MALPGENSLPGENPDEEGYLLHELQNASPPSDFETEQRDRMPEAAFLRENIELIWSPWFGLPDLVSLIWSP